MGERAGGSEHLTGSGVTGERVEKQISTVESGLASNNSDSWSKGGLLSISAGQESREENSDVRVCSNALSVACRGSSQPRCLHVMCEKCSRIFNRSTGVNARKSRAVVLDTSDCSPSVDLGNSSFLA